MYFLALLPYAIIGLGLVLGQVGLRPAMRIWGICMIGALSGLGAAIAIAMTDQATLWLLVALAALPFALALIMVIRDLSHPAINDVATDLENPIMFVAAPSAAINAGRDMTYPESFKPKVRKAYAHIRPLLLDEPADQVFKRITELAKDRRGWRVSHSDNAAKTIEAEAMTPLLRFVDDVIIQVSNHHRGSRVDMRSKSREGLVDAGTNAKRIGAFLNELQQGKGVD